MTDEERQELEERDVREIEESAPIPVRLILFLVGIALLVIFISQNSEEAQVELLWFEGFFPLSILIIGSSFLGAVIALLGGMIVRRRRRKERLATSEDETS
jgi:uncharacterized integral membrane protein